MVNTSDTDIIINVRVALAQANQKLAKLQKDIAKGGTAGNKAYRDFATQQQKVMGLQDKLNRLLDRMPFPAFALGVMFFGMAIKNALLDIGRASAKVFNEVMSSVSGTITGFQMLEGSMAFLKFVVGEALEPLMPVLIMIIDFMAQWVSRNEEIARSLFIIGVIFGVVLFVLGTLILGLSSLSSLWGRVVTVFKTGIDLVAGEGGFGRILSAIGKVTILIAILAAAFTTNFGRIQGFLKATIKNVVAGLTTFLEGVGMIFEGIWNIITGLFEGNLEKIGKGMKQILGGAIIAVSSILGAAFVGMINMVSLLWNGFVASISTGVVLILELVKATMNLMNRVFGTSMPTSGVDKLISKVRDLQNSASTGYVDLQPILDRTSVGVQEFFNIAPEQTEGGVQQNNSITINVEGNATEEGAALLTDGILDGLKRFGTE